jgi:hypothetical protein
LGSIASVAPKRAAILRRISAFSLTITWRAPRNFAHSIVARPTGPAPITTTVAPRQLRLVDGVQSHRKRLDHRAFTERNIIGQAKAAARSYLHEFRITTRALSKSDGHAFRARAAPSAEIDAGRLIAAADERKAGNAIAALPQMRDRFADRHHLAREFMPHHGARRGRHDAGGFRHMQIGTADAAIPHLEDECRADRARDRAAFR